MSIAEKLTTVAENMPKVFEAGQQAEYDRFWDEYQMKGRRTDGSGMFMGTGWNEKNMTPKYGMTVRGGYMMFSQCNYTGDLDDIFDNRGLPLVWNLIGDGSLSQGYFFYNSRITAIGNIDLSPITSATGVSSAFNSASIVTIRNLIPPKCAMGTTCWAAGLTNLGIGGAITKGFNLSRCGKLTNASVQSIIDHLADLTGQTQQTLTFHATVGGKLTEEQKATITANNWNLVY